MTTTAIREAFEKWKKEHFRGPIAGINLPLEAYKAGYQAALSQSEQEKEAAVRKAVELCGNMCIDFEDETFATKLRNRIHKSVEAILKEIL